MKNSYQLMHKFYGHLSTKGAASHQQGHPKCLSSATTAIPCTESKYVQPNHVCASSSSYGILSAKTKCFKPRSINSPSHLTRSS